MRDEAQKFITKATRALVDLQENDAKEALLETARFIGSRVV